MPTGRLRRFSRSATSTARKNPAPRYEIEFASCGSNFPANLNDGLSQKVSQVGRALRSGKFLETVRRVDYAPATAFAPKLGSPSRFRMQRTVRLARQCASPAVASISLLLVTRHRYTSVLMRGVIAKRRGWLTLAQLAIFICVALIGCLFKE